MTTVLWVCGAWVGLAVVTAAAFHFAKRSYLRSLGIRVGAPGEHAPPSEPFRPPAWAEPPCSHEDGWCVCVPEPSDPRWSA